MERQRKFEVWTIISIVIFLLLSVFLIWPLWCLLKESVILDGEFSLDAFERFFSQEVYWGSIINSVKVAAMVMALSLLIGIPFSYFYTFYTLLGRKLLFILCLLCSMSAPFIGAYAWILLLGNSGIITLMLRALGLHSLSIYGYWGVVFVETMKFFPLIVIYMNGAFRDIDSSLLEAAESMGCTGAERFRRVLMSLTAPTILAGALLVFMRSFEDFGTPVLIGRGYSTFPVLIYNAYLGENGSDYHFAAAISVIAVLITAIIFIAQNFATSRFKFSINALHPVSPSKPKPLQGFLMNLFCYIVLGVSFLPQIYIIFMSFRNYKNSIQQPGYSLANWERAMSMALPLATRNTLIVSFAALFIIVIVAVLLAYLVVRRSNFFNHMLDTFSMMPYIMPGAVIGIALITAFSRKPFALTGTLTIMIIALAIRRLPFTSRSASATMMSIPLSTEEAALSLGAPKLRTFVDVTVPQMMNGIISGAVLSFVSIITEMSSGIILYNNRTITLTIATYTSISSGIYGVAAVYATVATIFTIACLLIYLKISGTEDVRM
jgi:iron(III) transport system permease protein